MQTIATYNFKGGVGKTATAVNVAYLAARDGQNVLLWDLDPQGAATFTFRIKPKLKGGSRRLLRGRKLGAGIRASDFERLDLLPSDFSYRHLDVLLGERDDAVAELLEPLADEYDLVVLDCAPTLSAVTENVLTAAQVILAPTIPTALSLRTLARFMKHLKKREHRPRVMPFFCMVDRRKTLHRRVCDWAHRERLGFLATEIPYSSAVEQMSVRRTPLAEFARGDRAAKAYEKLWDEVQRCIHEGKGKALTRKALDSLYERALHRRGDTHAGQEIEFKLRLGGAADLEAVASAAERRGARRSEPVDQENHFFDTDGGALRAEGLVVRLRREGERYVLAVKGPRLTGADENVHVRSEEEAEVAPKQARKILDAGRISLDFVQTALGAAGPALVTRLRDVSGTERLGHVGSFRNRRLRVGPLRVESSGALTLELDRTELPGGRVDHELELEVDEHDRSAGERILAELLTEAAVVGSPATSKAKRFFEALQGENGGDRPA